jgi:hypothetical protein
LNVSRGSVARALVPMVWHAAALISAHPARSSWSEKYGLSKFAASRAPGTARSDFTRSGTVCEGPSHWPFAVIEGATPEFRWRIEVTWSGACGAQACQASIASSADDHGHSTLK